MSKDFHSGSRPGVSLAPLGPEYAENMFRWMRDPDVHSNVGLRTEATLEKTHLWIRRALSDPEIHAYAVLLDGSHVGNVIFDRLDVYLGNARLSIYIGEREARGAGVGSTALRLGLAEAFDKLSLHKVWLTVHVYNAVAIRLYLNAGFVMEGILRDEFRLDGEFVSVFYMGILRDDFARRNAIRTNKSQP